MAAVAWSDQIFRYCERGADPSFWAEPLNALSNGAFILAAIAAAVHLAHSRREVGGARVLEALLVVLVLVIGVGSFLFHTTATRWAAIADTAPIGLFMLGYFGYALRRFAGAGVVTSLVGVALFVVALRHSVDIPCSPGLLPITQAGGHPCFNGSLGYLPALAALGGIGAILVVQGHPAGRWVLAAGLVFAASLTLRTIDFEVCGLTRLLGRARGTHALWHLLNALTLYLLLVAAVRHGHERCATGSPGA